MNAKVTHFEIFAEEPRRLARFYRELFGWTVVKAIDTDYFHIHLTPAQTELRGGVMLRPLDTPRSWVSYVLVDSIDDTLRAVVRLGGRIVRGKTALPGKAWSAMLGDPEQNIFVVYELDPAAAEIAETEEALAFEQ